MLTVFHYVPGMDAQTHEIDVAPDMVMAALDSLNWYPEAAFDGSRFQCETAFVYDLADVDEAGLPRAASFFRCQRGCWHEHADEPTETASPIAA
ncbi:hypothetical protein ACFVH6_25565 [Spirillospora sp. NPDC127200]